jgi:hypothetical protein
MAWLLVDGGGRGGSGGRTCIHPGENPMLATLCLGDTISLYTAAQPLRVPYTEVTLCPRKFIQCNQFKFPGSLPVALTFRF